MRFIFSRCLIHVWCIYNLCVCSQQAEVSDSAYLGSESAYSECETFTDEDTTALVHPELHEDVETDSGIENTLTDGDDRSR